MYEWRRMSPEEREAALALRRLLNKPWHSPPRWHNDTDENGPGQYLMTGTCYNHEHVIGTTSARMDAFLDELLDVCRASSLEIYAWAVLTNHYHVLLRTDRLRHLLAQIGRLHGRTSRCWNREESAEGRHVWHGGTERRMKSERHFWTTMNYVHHQAVRHDYVKMWQDWPWSSAPQFLEKVGRDEALRIWHEYPLRNYGDKWDL